MCYDVGGRVCSLALSLLSTNGLMSHDPSDRLCYIGPGWQNERSVKHGP